ncbi:MAG: hypothetical protein HKN87_22320, partial [Saprospiraceae bacterium]|nr:hypothetical protein [Saprospiraceae bacterium]
QIPGDVKQNIQDLNAPVSNWIVLDGNDKKIFQIDKSRLKEFSLEINKRYNISENSKSSYSIVHLFPDAAFLSSTPSSRNDQQENPVARVEVKSSEWTESQNAFLFPHQRGGLGRFRIEGTNYFLALESTRDRETKYWKSDLSIINERGNELERQVIEVNEPMRHKGYRFYQTDYDPNNPSYSGIGVSYTPGLYIVYLGFITMFAGIILLFYLRTSTIPDSELQY